ncbi:MAG: transcription antitermination factor NusB [Novosphingobium sp.]|nr:transcription antitermination factor NusB [Novosphingobium sp.]MBO9600962.1 transcription antitermination factor NusB [Novosphingobium sp.]
MSGRSKSRSSARLSAVQALYQHEMEGTPAAKLIDDFHQHYIGREIDDEGEIAEAEIAFFDDIVKGVLARRDEIDGIIEERLSAGWNLKRLDKTMLQILRAGTYELLARPDVPLGSAISEYVDVAHAFFDRPEPSFVNGVLDGVAKAVRS